MFKADIGLVGLAVMGENLALNFESRGFRVAVYNRTSSRTFEFLSGRGRGKAFVGCESAESLVDSLVTPRVVLLMVKAGAPVDAVIADLAPLLSPGDLLVDGGNSLWTDTVRRSSELKRMGLLFVGMGVSGGEEGALHGPSLMPGGPVEAWERLRPMLTAIAAKTGPSADVPCCDHVGPDGAGHYVKMVHNGIEYGDMQLIAEAWQLLVAVGVGFGAMASIFDAWNRGPLDSYLVEITARILATTDPLTGRPMVEVIRDSAGQKGTGKWTSESALHLGVPATTLVEAVMARALSGRTEERSRVAAAFSPPVDPPRLGGDALDSWVRDVHDALHASKVCAYAQGFQLLRAAGHEQGWNLDLGRIAQLWRGGCIIRARFLDDIHEAFRAQPQLDNLLLAPAFAQVVRQSEAGWRRVVAAAATWGVPVPAFASALSWFDGCRTARGSASLIQAQRDFFGAHTFERFDRDGIFHHNWTELPS